MNWLTQLFRSKTVLAVALNGLTLLGFVALRFMIPAVARRPALTLPRTTDLSIANWLAARIADVAALLEALIQRLLP